MYTEKDLFAAFRCGMQECAELQGAPPGAADKLADSVNVLDALFYQGFGTEKLFVDKPGFQSGA